MARLILLAFGIAFMALTIDGAAVPSELEEAGKATHAACITETGASEESVEKASAGNFDDNDDKLKCYLKCVFEKFQLTNEDSINFDAMLQIVPEHMKESGSKMIELCRDTTGRDLCDISYNVNKCFYQQNPKEFFVV